MAEVKINIDVAGAAAAAKEFGRVNSALDAQEKVANKLVLAYSRYEAAALELSDAQKRLAANTDPGKQHAMEQAVLRARVALDQQEKEVKELGEAYNGTAQKGNRLTDSFKDIVGAVGVPLTIGAIATAAIGAGQQMIRLGMAAEQTEMAFTTLIGSADGAREHLGELRDFAASTPFEFTDLTEASRKLQAFGFAAEDVIPMMTDIGDAVAAMGGNAAMIDRVTLAIGQMSAKGKIQAGEMLQLTEAGIPAWRYLAEAMGMSTAEVMKLSEKGLIPASEAIDDILEGMRKDFGGMMAVQAKTAAGKLSTLNDQLTALGTNLGAVTIPAVSFFVDALTTATSGLDSMLKIFGTWPILLGLATGAIDRDTAALRANLVAQGDYTAGLGDAVAVTEEFEREARRFAPIIADVAEETEKGAGAGGAFAEATLKIPPALVAAEEQLKRNAESVKALNFLMGGAVGNELEKYREKQGELRDTAADLAMKIDTLNGKEHLTKEQKAQLEEYKTKYAEVNTALDENATAHENAMKRIMFSILQGQLAADGFTTAEVLALTSVAEKWGLVDTATKDATDNIAKWVGEAQATGNWELLYQRIDEYNRKVSGVPDRKVTEFVARFTTEGNPNPAYGDIGLPGGGSAPVIVAPGVEGVPVNGALAAGGPVRGGGAYLVGERGPELFVPNTGGRVLNNGETMTMGGIQVSMVINAAPGQSEMAIGAEVRRQLDDLARRGDVRRRL